MSGRPELTTTYRLDTPGLPACTTRLLSSVDPKNPNKPICNHVFPPLRVTANELHQTRPIDSRVYSHIISPAAFSLALDLKRLGVLDIFKDINTLKKQALAALGFTEPRPKSKAPWEKNTGHPDWVPVHPSLPIAHYTKVVTQPMVGDIRYRLCPRLIDLVAAFIKTGKLEQLPKDLVSKYNEVYNRLEGISCKDNPDNPDCVQITNLLKEIQLYTARILAKNGLQRNEAINWNSQATSTGLAARQQALSAINTDHQQGNLAHVVVKRVVDGKEGYHVTAQLPFTRDSEGALYFPAIDGGTNEQLMEARLKGDFVWVLTNQDDLKPGYLDPKTNLVEFYYDGNPNQPKWRGVGNKPYEFVKVGTYSDKPRNPRRTNS